MGACIYRYTPAAMLGNLPEVIDPVAMICMVMGDDHAVDVDYTRCKQLLAKVGTAVDEKSLA